MLCLVSEKAKEFKQTLLKSMATLYATQMSCAKNRNNIIPNYIRQQRAQVLIKTPLNMMKAVYMNMRKKVEMLALMRWIMSSLLKRSAQYVLNYQMRNHPDLMI